MENTRPWTCRHITNVFHYFCGAVGTGGTDTSVPIDFWIEIVIVYLLLSVVTSVL